MRRHVRAVGCNGYAELRIIPTPHILPTGITLDYPAKMATTTVAA
jgi:hypothetical protein